MGSHTEWPAAPPSLESKEVQIVAFPLPLGSRLLLCLRILLNAAYLSLPLIGVLVAHSVLWNLIWWLVFAVWVSLFVFGSSDTALVGVGASLGAVVATIELDAQSFFWFLITGVFVVLALRTSFQIYKEEAIRTFMSDLHSASGVAGDPG